VEHSLRAHKLRIDDGTERALVRLDPRVTSAALAHLLENAGQYSPPGSTITVTLSSDELRIAVRDEGGGLRQTISTTCSNGSIAVSTHASSGSAPGWDWRSRVDC
jgi:K+-sensing histidine kinase KdpD